MSYCVKKAPLRLDPVDNRSHTVVETDFDGSHGETIDPILCDLYDTELWVLMKARKQCAGVGSILYGYPTSDLAFESRVDGFHHFSWFESRLEKLNHPDGSVTSEHF